MIMKCRRVRQATGLAAVLCAAVGILLCGNGMWIHAKGLLAKLQPLRFKAIKNWPRLLQPL